MTLSQVVNLLRSAGVPDWFYETGGGLGAGECLGIERTARGWQIYYSERGGKSPLEQCADEDQACRALYRYVDQNMRGSGRSGLPPLP